MARRSAHPHHVKTAVFIIILLIAAIASVGFSRLNIGFTNKASYTSPVNFYSPSHQK